MTIYERRAYLIANVVVGAALLLFLAIDILRDISDISIVSAVAFAVIAFATYYYFKRLRQQRPLAVLTKTGVTDEYGHTLTWDVVTKIHMFTGVLFIADAAKAGWRIRLDPAEIGSDKVQAAISFIKRHAPRHLSEGL